MDEIQQRSVVRFMMLQKKASKAIHEELMSTMGDNVVAYATVKKWAALFKTGRDSVDDDPSSGRPLTGLTEENVKAVENLVMEDRRVSVRRIAAEVKLSVGSIETILHDHLNMFKASTR